MKSASWLLGLGIVAPLFLAAYTCDGVNEGPPASVTFYLGSECPATRAYVSRINQVAKKYADKGVAFTAYFPQGSDTAEKVRTFVRDWKLDVPWQMDIGAKLATRQAVGVVPCVVVTDRQGRVVYRGAIDDNKNAALARKPYLADALGQTLDGKPVALKETKPQGCVLSPSPRPTPMEPATYADTVARILNDHCVQCHRPGEVAPFSLIGYENARNWAPTIAVVASSRKMPPWKAVPGIGDFKHENRLTDEEVATLEAWAKAKAPRGDATKEPAAPKFPANWALGDPDIVLQAAKPFKVSADGQDEYWHFVLKPQIKEPVYVQAIDVKPGNKKIVHHVILWVDERGQADKVLAKQGREDAYLTFGSPGFIPDNSLGGWAPGMQPERSPDDAGILLKPGANVVMEVHYHKSGKEETDQTKVGVYLAKDKSAVKNKVRIAWLANLGINIKAGEASQKFTQTVPIPVDVKLYSLMPHMHLLGREMKATLIRPDGTEQPLIFVDDWDFNWQFVYSLKEPMTLKGGSKIRIEAVFDNSSSNPNNPNDPPKDVRWGEQTTDEMMLLVAAISVPDTALGGIRDRVRRRGGN